MPRPRRSLLASLLMLGLGLLALMFQEARSATLATSSHTPATIAPAIRVTR